LGRKRKEKLSTRHFKYSDRVNPGHGTKIINTGYMHIWGPDHLPISVAARCGDVPHSCTVVCLLLQGELHSMRISRSECVFSMSPTPSLTGIGHSEKMDSQESAAYSFGLLSFHPGKTSW
jgi:hypothetical protein